MGDAWKRPPSYEAHETDERERGELLADLLLLTDALPPMPHHDLAIPPFRELCGRR